MCALSVAVQKFISDIKKTADNRQSLINLLESNVDLISQNVVRLDIALSQFEIEKWTILHAAILRYKLLSTDEFDPEHLIKQFESLFSFGKTQDLREIKPILRIISQEMTVKLIKLGLAIRGIPILLIAIKKIQNSDEQLTSFHVDICQLALSARCFRPVLSLLDADILDTENNTQAFKLDDLILYFYYGGMIYAAVKNWSRCLHFFEMCFIKPAAIHKAILIEVAKKYIVVSLLHFGKYPAENCLYNSKTFMMGFIRLGCKKYTELASAFSLPDSLKLENTIRLHIDAYLLDKNYGLVKQLLDKHIKWKILNLTKTFMTLSLSDMANHVHLNSAQVAEKHLLEMIKEKSINVKIDQQHGTVSFLDDPEKYDSVEMVKILSEKIELVMNMEKKMMLMSDRLNTGIQISATK